MRAFIVRPFNTQSGVDFEAVEHDLIAPALDALTIEGRTTQEIAAQGNIRADMFRMLVSAELVVADLSIHNANVFYELGIRHGLRNSATFLMRANIDKYPFDLSTDRYFVYDAANPKASLDKLVVALRATLATRNVDSPVYQMLPALKPPDPASLQAAPADFREDVERARDGEYCGDLRLLAHEARGFEWEREGLRCVGKAQLKLQAYPGAKETFEWLLKAYEDDIDAWQRLATVYQRLATEDAGLTDAARAELLARSTQAIRRVLESPAATARHLAEGYALQGRNVKSEWRDVWKAKTGSDAAAAALRSPLLKEAADLYAKGFEQDVGHCYSGLNAMSLYRLLTELARSQPMVWAEPFETEEEARLSLKNCDDLLAQLAGAVRWCMRATRTRLDGQTTRDDDEALWLAMSDADYTFLTSVKPGPAAQAYRKVLSAAPAFDVRSAREQLDIFRLLGVRADLAAGALAVFDELAPQTGQSQASATAPARVLLFTGHMVDAENRKTPRFPRTAAAEAEALRMITEAVSAEVGQVTGPIVAVAGGACGGDLLFHEACERLGVKTELYLSLPPERFVAASVARGGPSWVERFNRLRARIGARVLADTAELPDWLSSRAGSYTIWNRNNLWTMYNALAHDAPSMTLIALWDGGGGDGPGGTADLVQQTSSRGHKVVTLDAKRLRNL